MALPENDPTSASGSGGAPRLAWITFGWQVLTGLAAAVAAVFSLLANTQSTKNADALNQLKFQAESRAQQSALDIKVYELVEKALSLEGPAAKGQGVAAAAIINALTDPPLRDQLMGALRAGSKDEALIKQLNDALEFDAQGEPTAPAAAPSPSGTVSQRESLPASVMALLLPRLSAQSVPRELQGYRVDVFYCEAAATAVTESRKSRADAAAARLNTNGGTITVRVRNLPLLVQARPAYQSFADEIRYDDPRKATAARSLASILKIKPENVRRVNVTSTPNYLSVYFCAPQ